jgi:hypothetical protein
MLVNAGIHLKQRHYIYGTDFAKHGFRHLPE